MSQNSNPSSHSVQPPGKIPSQQIPEDRVVREWDDQEGILLDFALWGDVYLKKLADL